MMFEVFDGIITRNFILTSADSSLLHGKKKAAKSSS